MLDQGRAILLSGIISAFAIVLVALLPYLINQPPVADLSGNKCVVVNSDVQFSGKKSYDPDEKIVSREWYIDGNFIIQNIFLEQKFTKSGTHTIELVVFDNGVLKITDDFYLGQRTNTKAFVINVVDDSSKCSD